MRLHALNRLHSARSFHAPGEESGSQGGPGCCSAAPSAPTTAVVLHRPHPQRHCGRLTAQLERTHHLPPVRQTVPVLLPHPPRSPLSSPQPHSHLSAQLQAPCSSVIHHQRRSQLRLALLLSPSPLRQQRQRAGLQSEEGVPQSVLGCCRGQCRQHSLGRRGRRPRVGSRLLRSEDLRQQHHSPPCERHGVSLAVECTTSELKNMCPPRPLHEPTSREPARVRALPVTAPKGAGTRHPARISLRKTRTYPSRGRAARAQPTPPCGRVHIRPALRQNIISLLKQI